MIVGSEKIIDKETSSFVDELQINSKSMRHQTATTKTRVSSAWRLLHPRIEMNESTEESANIYVVHLPIHGSVTDIGIAIVCSSFATLILDPVHHEQTNLMLKLMLCNTRQRKEALKESRQCTENERSLHSLDSASRRCKRSQNIANEKPGRFSGDNTAAVWRNESR